VKELPVTSSITQVTAIAFFLIGKGAIALNQRLTHPEPAILIMENQEELWVK
jgi:hypothetical protein